MVATEAPIVHSGSIAVLYMAVDHFYVESLQTYWANVISFQLASGDMGWYILGCYLAPDNASTIEDVVAAIGKRPQGATLIVFGDFNSNLVEPEGHGYGKAIPEDVSTAGLTDMADHFLTNHILWEWDCQKWIMILQCQEVNSQIDFICGTGYRLFQNFSVRDPRHNKYH